MAIDRYFESFEAGTPKAEPCNEKVRNLRTRMEESEGEKRGLEARRERLEIPAIDREMFASLSDNLENPGGRQGNGLRDPERGDDGERDEPAKKHLLRHMVKKVLIHDRRTIEVWYGLPNQASVRTAGHLAPRMCRCTNPQVEPEAWFRVLYLGQFNDRGATFAYYRDQAVEIALGSKGAFENGNIGAMTRRMATVRVPSAVPPGRGSPKPPRESKTPRVVEPLRKAIEWQALLESGKITSQADIALQEGITRVRVTQVLGMPHLAPEIREKILSMPKAVHRPQITKRVLRPICAIPNYRDQLLEFHMFLG